LARAKTSRHRGSVVVFETTIDWLVASVCFYADVEKRTTRLNLVRRNLGRLVNRVVFARTELGAALDAGERRTFAYTLFAVAVGRVVFFAESILGSGCGRVHACIVGVGISARGF